MILLFDYLSNIDNQLSSLKSKGRITDYKITLRINNRAIVFVQIESESEVEAIKECLILDDNNKIVVEYVFNSEIQQDPYLKELFSSNETLMLDSRKSLSNLLAQNDDLVKAHTSKVITFYSFKGGVGRSTALASFAAFLSNNCNLKVLIIDCDLEAPGFTNYFLEEPSQVNNHIGVVEYFMDLDFKDQNIEISNYVWEVGKDFCGAGNITIMPAGNLSDENILNNKTLSTHKKHYLEGLSRIDTSSTHNLLMKFNYLLEQVDSEIKPNVILIDSRTGFNDIFGLTAFKISDIVVGLFGSNVQNLPGLNYFIERVIESKHGLNAVLLNSIISKRSQFYKFSEYVDNYTYRMSNSDSEETMYIKTFPVSRWDILESLGTNDEKKEDFIDLIKNHRFPDYNEIFNYVYSLIDATDERDLALEKQDVLNNVVLGSVSENLTYTQEVDSLIDRLLDLDLKEVQNELPRIDRLAIGVQKGLKKRIISNLEKNWPSLYAEKSKIELENVFYRRSMEDVFNPNKFIILGNKGTGKTFLYEALKNPEITKKIQERSQKSGVFEFIHVIDIANNKFFDTNHFDPDKGEVFYHKFWVVYIWNAIMLESEKRFGYKSKLVIHQINNNIKTKIRFEEYIENEELFIKVEDDLENLESFLKVSKFHQKLVVIFDGLDQIVKPINWPTRIVPLINFWRYNNFTRISPKLFLRSDLFEKLSNITNIKELRNQAISIEWSQDELFGFFFKLVLSSAKNEFLRYMLFTKNNSYELIKQIKVKSGNDNQLPLEEYFLRPLVKSFFGQYASADHSPRFGESYDWFYRNLKNANNTISLRPFIDLIHNAIKYAKSDDNSIFPILPAFYYVHGEARKTALGNHFSDLVSEQGNEYLKYICDFIRERKSKSQIYLEMTKPEMNELLNEIIETAKLDNTNIDDLTYLLKVNGIINESFRSSGIFYSFALLYKYYLGLKNRPKVIRIK